MNALDSRFPGSVDIEVGKRFGHYAVRRRGAGSWELTQYCNTINEIVTSVQSIADKYRGSADVYVDLWHTDVTALRGAFDNKRIRIHSH